MNHDEFEHDEGPGFFYPVIWYLICLAAIVATVLIARCAP